jgi:hypothetical protein
MVVKERKSTAGREGRRAPMRMLRTTEPGTLHAWVQTAVRPRATRVWR